MWRTAFLGIGRSSFVVSLAISQLFYFSCRPTDESGAGAARSTGLGPNPFLIEDLRIADAASTLALRVRGAEDGRVLPHASLRFRKPGQQLKALVADDEGWFSLPLNPSQPGRLTLWVGAEEHRGMVYELPARGMRADGPTLRREIFLAPLRGSRPSAIDLAPRSESTGAGRGWLRWQLDPPAEEALSWRHPRESSGRYRLTEASETSATGLIRCREGIWSLEHPWPRRGFLHLRACTYDARDCETVWRLDLDLSQPGALDSRGSQGRMLLLPEPHRWRFRIVDEWGKARSHLRVKLEESGRPFDPFLPPRLLRSDEEGRLAVASLGWPADALYLILEDRKSGVEIRIPEAQLKTAEEAMGLELTLPTRQGR